MNLGMLRSAKLFRVVLALTVVIATFVGWKLFLFTVDDAYIAFRYVSNGLAGYGLTWNPPPFRAVEGYSSFLWVVVLREVWRIFGVEPPAAANYLSLAFGYATLFMGYRFIARMRLPDALSSKRWILIALVMLGTVSNRTFLTWLSSGLETSLFNFVFTWWIYVGTTSVDGRSRSWAARLSIAATATALTRPDGLLVAAATPVMIAAASAGPILHAPDLRKRVHRALQALRGCWPLLGLIVHLVWRRLTYGEWLPNTYYAKHVAPWPESGARYAASFVVEYGLWVWLLFVVGALASALRRRRVANPMSPASMSSHERWIAWLERSPPVITVAIVVAHFGYYTFRVGGDHFEYRVYSHLILLLFVSAVWLLSWIVRCWPGPKPLRSRVVFAAMLFLIVSSWPIPWSHWAQTHNRSTRAETFPLIQPLAPSFPGWARPIIARWDDWQAWLIGHSVGKRHQEHKVFSEFQRNLLPARGQSKLRLEGQGRAVAAGEAVGVLGWVLRDVAIIDVLGLNDHVVARNPETRRREDRGRHMAHDRKPPDGYVECFRPNVVVRAILYARPRSEPLTDAEIIACEAQPWY
jgi:arabinofuranosyltransferase